jgi:thiosulfate/3-mercaptopyruvate sulfurtransferase
MIARTIVRWPIMPFTTLIDAPTLARQLDRDDLVVIDCRFDLGDPGWGENEYTSAHLPGAIYAHLDRHLSGAVTSSSGRHPLPDPHGFAEWLASIGVDEHCQVIAYDQGSAAYAARLWWLSRWVGLRAVAVLDGGIASWRTAGLPLDAQVRPRAPRRFTPHIDAQAWVTSEDVDSARVRPGNLIVDARGAERFAGRNETLDPVGGHVPGARNLPFLGNLGADGKFLGVETLRQRWSTMLGSLPPTALIAMCGSGVTACHNLLALEHAGLAGARLYAGSWSEWIRDASRPIESGPSP